jgi:hypothetical protein
MKSQRPPAPRLRDVLCYLAEGHSHKAIAHELGITESTVNSYVKRLKGHFQDEPEMQDPHLSSQRALILIAQRFCRDYGNYPQATSSNGMPGKRTFREVFEELYTLCCERQGWDTKQSMSSYAKWGGLSQESVRKIFTGEDKVLNRESINALLDSLYKRGVIAADEKELWHGRLHEAHIFETTLDFLTQRVDFESLPKDLIKDIRDDLEKFTDKFVRRAKDFLSANILGGKLLDRIKRTISGKDSTVEDS